MKQKYFIGSCVFIVCFWLLMNNSSNSIYHFSDSAFGIETKTSLNNVVNTVDPNSSHLKRQLWLAGLNMAEVEKNSEIKNELRRMIKQIRSVNFGSQNTVPETNVAPEYLKIHKTVEIASEEDKKQENKEYKTEQREKEEKSDLEYGSITKQTMQTIRDLSKNPGNLQNPFELGETLFLSGYLKEAAIFYKEALKRESLDDAGSAKNRAWIIFQIGNCLRNENRDEAMKMYELLITEYPNSPWKELAEARRALLNWYLKENPRKLITESKR